MRDVAIAAAKRAGEVAKTYFEQTTLERMTKDDKSFVTIADKEAETAIVACIRDAYPDHGIVGEEGTALNPDSPYQWIIDPIDGTTNFVNGIPIFGTSIALAERREVILGVVYNPVTDSLFVAEKGKGATYNGKPIHVSDQTGEKGLVTFGFGAGHDVRRDELFVSARSSFKSRRTLGSSAIELCYVARGGIEATIMQGLSSWDYAAGALIVTEAGGMVTEHSGAPWRIDSRHLIASNGITHESLKELVQG